jgi:hypothetical protein
MIPTKKTYSLAICQHFGVPTSCSDLPPNLLQAVADVSGKIALIIGAGCSLEEPTNLDLASVYAARVHDALVADGVITNGECTDPSDLSLIASLVYGKEGTQEPVVSRLPRGRFRDAQANDGYLIAAALLLEGAVAAVLTLNFDLAMSDALGIVGAEESVSVIAEPKSLDELGSRIVIYLHRNANEANEEKWVLRAEVIDDAWKGQWEEVIAQRIVTHPMVVFAGLGSPAAVLTESVAWLRSRLAEDTHKAYVVDPSGDTQFKEALDLPADAHIQMGWGDFMHCLAGRLTVEQERLLVDACTALCVENGWDDEIEGIEQLATLFFGRGLLASGQQRSTWLMHGRKYVAEEELNRGLVAYLLLGLGLAQRHCEVTMNLRHDGVVEMRRDGRVVGSCLPVSAGGTRQWTAMEPRVRKALGKFSIYERPTAVLLGSLQGPPPDQVTPPTDIVFDDSADDIVSPASSPAYISIDSLRSEPALADQMVA